MIKLLLDEVDNDIIDYQCRGLSCLPKPKAEADNTDTRFDYSRYHTFNSLLFSDWSKAHREFSIFRA